MNTDAGKTAIRALIETINKAHHDKHAGTIVAQYAPGAVIFDLAPPLVSAIGTDAGKLQAWLDGWDGPVDRQSRDLDVAVSGDLAFCHGLFRTSAMTRTGEHAVFWTRSTLCLRRAGGSWTIVHEHESVPFYMDGSFRAAVDLEP